MLFVHETHKVHGRHEDEFDALFRDGLIGELGRGDDARLLWFLRLVHGAGRSYEVSTVTAVRDGAAWERLARRFQDGDLRAWAADADRYRHEVRARLLLALPWSPLTEVVFDDVPTADVDHEQTLFMEDTAWPHEARLDDYLDAARTHYAPSLEQQSDRSLLELVALFQTAWGAAARRREVVLWQRVVHPERLVGLFLHDLPARVKAPGTWMHDALDVRDDWESRLLRTARWSPLP